MQIRFITDKSDKLIQLGISREIALKRFITLKGN